MGRVLVVSRNLGLAMGLSATDHDIIDIRPAAFDAWVDDARDEHLDGVVLDMTDADSALHAITELRARAQMAPVLVVPGDGPGWDDLRMHELPAASMLPFPVTRPALQDAVDRLVSQGPNALLALNGDPEPAVDHSALADPDPIPEPRPEPDPDAPPLSRLQAARLEAARAAAEHPETAADVAPARVLPVGPPPPDQLLAGGPHANPTDTVEAAQPDPRPRRGQREPDVGLSDLVAVYSAGPAPWEALESGRAASSADASQVLAELVRALLGRVGDIYSVNETAELVVTDAVERTGAEAGAVLLLDGERWRVAAGVGLRPLEHRFELTADDWLAVEVARGRHSVVIEDTDIARQPLRGSPLAAWHHLVATPVPVVDGVLLVARSDEPPFTAADLESLGELALEAAPLVAAALEARSLARALGHLRDTNEPQPGRSQAGY